LLISILSDIVSFAGEWPIVINDRTAFSVGNHSLSIAAADSIGLTAQGVVFFTLGNGTRTNRELAMIYC